MNRILNKNGLIMALLLVLVLVLSACGGSSETSEVNETSSEDVSESVMDAVESSADDTSDGQEADTNESADSDEASDVSEEVASSEAAQQDESELQDYIDLELVDKDGNPVRISDYEGKFIVLNFFGVWCQYCMQEMPDLEAFYSGYEGDDFVIILINATTTESMSVEEIVDWYDEEGWTMPMMMDLDGIALQTYPVQGFPTSYFINKDGKVLGAVPGVLDQALLDEIVSTYNN